MELPLPTGSHLELSYYVADVPEQVTFTRLIATLVHLGAQFTGVGEGHIGEYAHQPFDMRLSLPLEDMVVRNMQDVNEITADPNRRLVTVYMTGASGINPGIAEFVTYTLISPEAAQQGEYHPLAIWTKDGDLGYPFSIDDPDQAHKLGLLVYQRFRNIVLHLQPAYANITIEGGLQSPYDLRHNRDMFLFRDFFISRGYIGDDGIATLQNLLSKEYIEGMGDGVYFSTWPFFNPRRHRRVVSDEAFEHIQKEIARLVGHAAIK